MNNELEVYKIQGSRVFGQGRSYNCTNIVTAKDLQCTLNSYEKTLADLKTAEQKLDSIQKSIIQIQLSLGILSDDIHKLKEVME